MSQETLSSGRPQGSPLPETVKPENTPFAQRQAGLIKNIILMARIVQICNHNADLYNMHQIIAPQTPQQVFAVQIAGIKQKSRV
jgi:hypothetical protein